MPASQPADTTRALATTNTHNGMTDDGLGLASFFHFYLPSTQCARATNTAIERAAAAAIRQYQIKLLADTSVGS